MPNFNKLNNNPENPDDSNQGGFENLGQEVPFAGDALMQSSTSESEENPPVENNTLQSSTPEGSEDLPTEDLPLDSQN